MSGHVYVTACGFGKRIIPARAPCELSLTPGGSVVVVVGQERRSVAQDEPPRESLTADDQVAGVVSGPDAPGWWLDAGVFRIPFPAAWTAVADGGVLPPYFLMRPDNRSVFVQVARNIPTGEKLVAPYQSVVDRSPVGPFESVELSYQHEGQTWLQRHTILTRKEKPYAVLTAQAPVQEFAETRQLQIRIAGEILFA